MINRFQLTDGCLKPGGAEDSPIQLFVNPEGAERELLRTAHEVDEHTLSSALDPDEVSRLEANPSHLLLIWKQPTNCSFKDAFFFDVSSMGMLLFDKRLVIIVKDDCALNEGGARLLPLRTPLDVMLRLLYNTVQHYLGHLKVIKMISREVQQKINTSMENKHLIQMFDLSESLIYYINAIISNGVVLTRLRNHAEKLGFSAQHLAFIDDLIIDNNQCCKQAEIYSTVFSGLMDARGNLVNNNMNVLLKNLTIINVIFLPLNLIAGIGGMSEFSVMTHGIDWRISYSLLCAGMLAVGWLTAVILKKDSPSHQALSKLIRRK